MRVLIAEAGDVLRRKLETAVTNWGYAVTSAASGDEAWQVLENDDAPQLAILNWVMPGIGGAEVCRRVRERHRQRYTYLIMVPAGAERLHIVQGLQAGADDLLTKPFDSDELEQRLRAGARIVKLQDKLLTTQETLRKQATHDALTGVMNRGGLYDALQCELDRCRREKTSLGVVMADLALYQAKGDGRNCVRYDLRGSCKIPLCEPEPTNVKTQKTVLVVDDDDCVREVICRWLTAAGYTCAQAGDADAALKHLQTSNVQLITLDIDMPGPSGLDLLPRIKQRFPETETIMLTASGKTEAAVEALTRGACGYLIKPVERDTLLSEVDKAFQQRQSRLNRRRYTSQLEQKIQKQTFAIRRAHEETIHRLITASMHRDEETGAHIRRVGLYSEVMAAAFGWPATKVEQIRMAAPMHDVGKIGIPDSILQKPGKLTDDEFEIMKTHTTIGAQMLAGSESPMLQMAQEIALAHHERWDGSGYPQGLAETAIPESARIVATVDAYDALTHDRVYRAALSEEKALGIMRSGRGAHFDSDLLDLFFDVLPDVRRISKENPDKRSKAALASTRFNENWSAKMALEPMLMV